MKHRLATIAAAAALALVGTTLASTASARENFSVSIGVPGFAIGYGRPYVYAAPPVVYAPPVRYYGAPYGPVVYGPRVVYGRPYYHYRPYWRARYGWR